MDASQRAKLVLDLCEVVLQEMTSKIQKEKVYELKAHLQASIAGQIREAVRVAYSDMISLGAIRTSMIPTVRERMRRLV